MLYNLITISLINTSPKKIHDISVVDFWVEVKHGLKTYYYKQTFNCCLIKISTPYLHTKYI